MMNVSGTLSAAGASAAGAGGTAGGASTSGGASPAGGSVSKAGAGGLPSGGSGQTAGVSGAGTQAGSSSGGSSPQLTHEMIDDLEDNDERILPSNGRQGPWHIFNNQGNGGNQVPPFSEFSPDKGGANGTMYAVHTTGDGYEFAGVGFDLNNVDDAPESEKSQAFDASAFDGIAFWAKGTASLRLEIPTRNFVPEDRGGTCTASCWNVYGEDLEELGGDWREYRVAFSGMERESGGSDPAFVRDQLMSISFKHVGNSRFDFWVDEIRFYKGGDD